MDVSTITSSAVATAPSDGARLFMQATPTAQSTEAQKTAAAGTDASAQTPSPEQVAQAVKQVNDNFAKNGQNLYAAIEKDKTTGINVVKVMDKNTQEVISQFPSKAIIGLAEAISQSLAKKGQMFHVRA